MKTRTAKFGRCENCDRVLTSRGMVIAKIETLNGVPLEIQICKKCESEKKGCDFCGDKLPSEYLSLVENEEGEQYEICLKCLARESEDRY
jgi:ribosomal protein L40E